MKFWLSIFILILPNYFLSAQNILIDSLYSELKKSEGIPSKQLNIYIELSEEYIYYDPYQGLEYALKAKRISKQRKNDFLEARASSILGALYDVMGNKSKALIELRYASLLQSKLKDNKGLAKTFNTIGIIHFNNEEFQKAKHFFSEALRIESNQENITGMIQSNINLGVTSKMLNKPQNALSYYKQAFNILAQEGDSLSIFHHFLHVTELHIELGQLTLAKQTLEEIFNKNFLFDTPSFKSKYYLTKALLLNAQKEHLSSIQLLDSAFVYANKHHLYVLAKEALLKKSNLQNNLQLYADAVETLKQVNTISDSLYALEKSKLLSTMERKYKNEKEASEIANLKIANTMKEFTIMMERTEKQNLMIIIVLCLIILVVLTAFSFVNKEKNRRLKAQNTIIQSSYKEIEDLIKESHHRIKNNLQLVSSLLKLQSRSSENSDVKKALSDAQQRMKAIALIHQKLYQKSSFKTVNIQEFIIELVDNLRITFSDSTKHIDISTDIEAIEMHMDTAIPIALVTNELVTNSFKYAFLKQDDGKISIHIAAKNQEEIELKIEDNGEGFPEEFLLNEQGNFGYRIMNSLMKKLKGNIRSYNDNGAHVIINFKRDES